MIKIKARSVTVAMAALQAPFRCPPAYHIADILLTTWGLVMLVVFAG